MRVGRQDFKKGLQPGVALLHLDWALRGSCTSNAIHLSSGQKQRGEMRWLRVPELFLKMPNPKQEIWGSAFFPFSIGGLL